MDRLRIKDMRIYSAVSSITKPIADSTHDISKIAFYVLEVETEGGVVGQSNLLSFHYSPNAIEGALKDLKAFVLPRGYRVNEVRRIQREVETENEYFGIVGLQRWALAALNTACWDAWARFLDQPVWRVLGGSMKAIPQPAKAALSVPSGASASADMPREAGSRRARSRHLIFNGFSFCARP